jgi:molecular chaperone DnaJ
MKNYYDILGVSETSSQDEIKKAYRQLSKQYHPDVNPDGEEKFKEVAEAYDNIGDANKRTEYDNRRRNPFASMGGHNFDFSSVFEEMMNGQRNQRPRKAPDKVMNVEVTPVESYLGIKKELNYDYIEKCSPCNGEGGESTGCNICGGIGSITQKIGNGMFTQLVQSKCPSCNGKGKIIVNPCNQCYGQGGVIKKENLMITIPKNVDNGNFMRISGKGDYNQSMKLRGDLILQVKLDLKDNFEKNGNDLIYYLKLNVLDVLLQRQVKLPHPEGDLMINLPKNISSDKPLRLVKKGYRGEHDSGDFYVKMNITNDVDLDDDKLNKIKELVEQ